MGINHVLSLHPLPQETQGGDLFWIDSYLMGLVKDVCLIWERPMEINDNQTVVKTDKLLSSLSFFLVYKNIE